MSLKSNEFKEKASIKNDCPCKKCNIQSKYLIVHSCSHDICINCVYKYYMCSNFQNLTTSSIKIKCPICQKGQEEINLDDWIELLNQLFTEKNKEYESEQNNNEFINENDKKFCSIHKDKNYIKYCFECKTNLCEKCIREMHVRYYNNHNLIDLDKENNMKQYNIPIIKNNNQIKELQQKEKIFLQKLESESIMIQTKTNQLIKDLSYFLDSYITKINFFQINMKKIFQIINLSFYNYYLSNDQDKKEIAISKQLIDFEINSKKIELNEIIQLSQKTIKNFQEEEQIYNFEIKFEGGEYKKKFNLKQDGEGKPECVTKIIEIKEQNKLVSSLINGQLLVWDLYSNSLESTINAHKSAIWSMIKLSNQNVVTGSSDKLIKVFDINISEPLIKLKGHIGGIFSMGELEKNKIISGSEDRTIKVWDLNTKKCILNLEDPNGSKINCLHILKDNRFILTGGDDNLIKIWNIYSDYIPNVLSGHECTIWTIISITDDDSIIASGSSDNTIKIWDLLDLKCIFTLEGHENTISSIKKLNNNLLVSSSWDKTAKIWNLSTKKCIFTLKGHKDIIWDIIQLECGDLVTCSSDTNIIVWSKK